VEQLKLKCRGFCWLSRSWRWCEGVDREVHLGTFRWSPWLSFLRHPICSCSWTTWIRWPWPYTAPDVCYGNKLTSPSDTLPSLGKPTPSSRVHYQPPSCFEWCWGRYEPEAIRRGSPSPKMLLQKLVYSKGTQCRAEQQRDVVAAKAQDTPSLTSLNPRKQKTPALRRSCED
jgi:hypothetical protein